MEAFLLFILIGIVFMRWIYVRQRFSEMNSRIDALSRLVAENQGLGVGGLGLGTVPPGPEPTQVHPTPPPPKPQVEKPVPVLQPAARSVVPPAETAATKVETLSKAPLPASPAPGARPPAPLFEAPTPNPQPPTPGFGPPTQAFEPPTPVFQPPAPVLSHRRTSADWEALVGTNLFNKAGVFLVVIAIATLLGYAFKHTGPLGRVLMSLGTSFAMLAGGFLMEKRERYRTFAQGLLGGGWAALYFTVYAMQSIDAAKVIDNPLLGAVLLLAVATGMIVHSLKYRSQTVTGLAYFIAFVTLGISQVTPLSVLAVVPLAASLLYVSQRFGWRNFALFGLVATYTICATRGDTGAPLWQVQALFSTYWLLFEAFDLLRPHRAMLPMNAVGFLTLSLAAWYSRAPGQIWEFLAAVAVAYLVGAILRARSGLWRPPITLTAALLAAAIFLRLDHQWVALALLVEAELFFLAGVRLRADYLRYLAGLLFGAELGHLFVKTMPEVAVRTWTPVAVVNVVVFYANRALRSVDTYYGYAAAAMMALIAGFNAPHDDRGLAWMVLAAGPFLVGWQWRLPDFRYQAYGLAFLGPIGMVIGWPEPPLSIGIGAALTYAGVMCARWSPADRFTTDEQEALRTTGSLFASSMLAVLVWILVPKQYLGLGWMALGLVLLELGLRSLPQDFRRHSYILAVLGAGTVVYNNLLPIQNTGPLQARLVPAAAALLAYAMAARARDEEGRRVLDIASFAGTGFLLTALWALLPPVAVGPAWAVVALVLIEFNRPALALQCHLASAAAFARLFFANFDDAQPANTALTVLPVLVSHYYLWSRSRKRFYLYSGAVLAAVLARFEMGRVFTATGWAALTVAYLYAGRRWKLQDLCWQSYALAAMAFARCWGANFYSPDMFAGFAGPVFVGSTVIVCLYAAQLLNDLDSQPRLYLSVLASTLLAVLLYYQVSGSMLTVAWGAEGIALLSAGFPLRDRVLRLSGMGLLMFCILKLFVWDLRHLDTLPRILSFMVLGLILVAVSWVYTRFREILFGAGGHDNVHREAV